MLLLIICFLGVLGVLVAALYDYSAFWPWHLGKHRVICRKNVAYSNDNNPKHRLDIYLPNASKNYPIIHFTHGGYWHTGDKNLRSWLTGLYGAIGVTLARHGIGVVIINYRLIPEVDITGQITDLCTSINWTLQAAQDWDWNGKLYLMGHSAGGHLTTLLSASPELCQQNHLDHSRITGCIGLSPILDIPNMVANSDDAYNQAVSFHVFGNDPALWPTYSPIHAMRAQSTLLPTLLLYGQNDFKTITRQVPEAAHELPMLQINQIKHYKHGQLVSRFGYYSDPITKAILQFIQQ